MGNLMPAEQQIVDSYAPYHAMHAFAIGFIAYQNGRSCGPHHYQGVDEQAFDRGAEAAMKIARAARNATYEDGHGSSSAL